MVDVPAEWRDLLLLIPGYDSIATAPADCWFDPVAAKIALEFFPECLRHVEGALIGQPFVLERWQQSFIANLQGWKRKDEKGRTVRRYRETLLYVPRKNGKTPLVAGLALEILFTDDEAGQQNYVAAGEREQAGMLFRQCKGMVEREPELDARCKIYGGAGAAGQSKSIVRKNDLSFLRVISADAETKHGGSTHLGIVDELHVQPNRDLIDVLQTSMASANRKQPLLVLVTTADYDRPSICNEKHDYACKVRDGVIDDPGFLPVIYEAKREDKWDDEEVWKKANPNLHVSVSMEYLRRECKHAKEVPAFENTFRRLHLNQITSTAEKCIPMEHWDACAGPIDMDSLMGRECHGGLDIGATSDFTAFVLLFPHDDGETVDVQASDEQTPDGEPVMQTIVRRSYTLLPFFWLPAEPVRRDKRMQAQIDAWCKSENALIRVTPGNVVDYDQVLEDMLEITNQYGLVSVTFDKGFQGCQMGTNMQKHWGDRVKWFSQGILSMNAPFREFLELLATKRLHHGGHPVMRWMVSNVMGERRGGLLKPSKDKSPEKIDGVTAATMGIGGASQSSDANWYSPGSVFG